MSLVKAITIGLITLIAACDVPVTIRDHMDMAPTDDSSCSNGGPRDTTVDVTFTNCEKGGGDLFGLAAPSFTSSLGMSGSSTGGIKASLGISPECVLVGSSPDGYASQSITCDIAPLGADFAKATAFELSFDEISVTPRAFSKTMPPISVFNSIQSSVDVVVVDKLSPATVVAYQASAGINNKTPVRRTIAWRTPLTMPQLRFTATVSCTQNHSGPSVILQVDNLQWDISNIKLRMTQ